jgi:nucleotide-binding universal stress UspA family protein
MIADAEASLRQLTSFASDLELAPPLVRHGQPWRVILDVAEELDVDLVVLGSHGYHGMDRVLGTTAGKVANLSRRDVYVVHTRVEPPSSGKLLAGDERTGPYR